jgi:DNA polymerase V
VIVGDIVPQGQVQMPVFDTQDRGKAARIMAAPDGINGFMGRDKVHMAGAGADRKWKLRQEKLSPCYTTDWNAVMRVKA